MPVARPGGAWPFSASVYRWQPVVEAELEILRRQRQVDPLLSVELVLAVIAAESGGNPEAVSLADACGLMQLLPSTFRDLVGEADVFDPQLNVRAGILFLHRLLAQHQGALDWALVAYNAGPTVAARARSGNGPVYGETEAYVNKVYDLLERALAMRGVAPTPPP